MNNLFCSSCQINYESDELYKEHYKTDFHRYNIARKLINLAPVNLEQYKEKFNKVSESKVIQPKPQILYKCCKKEFKSTNTYETHLQSKAHKEYEIKPQSNIAKPLKGDCKLPTVCLFCDIQNVDIETCLEHMKTHGFFVREAQCVIDMAGLLGALSEQINTNMTCLHCFQTFKNASAVKNHMQSKGHCFMPQQEYKLLSKYYNFEEKLGKIIAQQNMKQIEGQILQKLKYTDEQNQDSDWEDDEEQPQKQENNTEEEERKQRLKTLLKQISKHKAKLLNNGELLLPGGKILGHRLYKKYYKQNHIPMKNFKEEQLRQLDDCTEDQIALLSDDLITGKLRYYYQQKQLKSAHYQTCVAMRQNQIIRRWLRKSC